MKNPFILVVLAVTLIFTTNLYAKRPYRIKTSAIPGKAIKTAVGPFSCNISLGGNSGGYRKGKPSPGTVDAVLVNVKSPQGAHNTIHISKHDLEPGIAQTVNLKGGGNAKGRTMTVYVPKLKNQFATIEVLVDDRADNALDHRHVIASQMSGSQYLKGKFNIGPFSVSLGITGSRRRDRTGNAKGDVSALGVSFQGSGFSKHFNFPSQLIFEGAVQTFELKTPIGRYSVEVEILYKGAGVVTVSLSLSAA